MRSPAAVSGGARRGRGGFVLAFVVLMLFAISVAGAAGYLVVMSEFGLAKNSSDGAEALTVARAGLQRFIAESIGVVGDSVSYALGDGVALVTSRKLVAQDSVTDLYYIRSEGTVADIRSANTPARRVVGAYATHRRRPLAHHALVMVSANTIAVRDAGEVDADDRDGSGTCSGGGASSITGVIARSSVTEESSGDIEGSPEYELWAGGAAQMLDSVGLRWDVLSDPDFPVDFDGTWPNFGSLPADSFPVIRQSGWLNAAVDGRGVLIVDGMFDPVSSFRWRGIVIARDVDNFVEGHLDGLLVAGLEANNYYSTVTYRMQSHYHSCAVYAANESLSYLELVENTMFEAR